MTTAISAARDVEKATGVLHMIRADIDTLQFRRWMGSRRLVDEDHAMHCLLVECFGDIAPRPFRLMLSNSEQRGTFHGYSHAGADELRDMASVFACPLQEKALPLMSLDSKPMPSEWQSGRRLGFEVRIRPVVRPTRNAGQRPCDRHYQNADSGIICPHCRPRKECDAFQYEATKYPRNEMPLSREAVYREWLRERFKHKGGVSLDMDSTSLVSFHRDRAIRKLGQQYSEGPDALMRGEIEVTDGGEFSRLLASGVGRHKAYGYGMLLLRPVISRGR